MSILGKFASLVYDAVKSNDLVGWIEKKAKELLGKGEGFVKGIWEQLKSGWTDLIPSIIAPAILKLVSYFVPGAGWIQGLYSAVSFVVTEASKLGDLFNTLKEAVTSAINGGAEVVNAIGTKVSSVIQKFLPVIFQGLADLLGLGNIPEKLGKVIGEVRTAVQKPIKDLLKAILAPVRSTVEKIFAKFSGKEIIGEVEDGHIRAWVEKDKNGNVEVWVEASPKSKKQRTGKRLKGT